MNSVLIRRYYANSVLTSCDGAQCAPGSNLELGVLTFSGAELPGLRSMSPTVSVCEKNLRLRGFNTTTVNQLAHREILAGGRSTAWYLLLITRQ